MLLAHLGENVISVTRQFGRLVEFRKTLLYAAVRNQSGLPCNRNHFRDCLLKLVAAASIRRKAGFRMKHGLLPLILLAAMVPTAYSQTADFYVATDGNDNNPGTLEQPFATFDKARQAVDTLFQNSVGRTAPIIVMFRGGTYYLSSTEAFAATDSGSSTLPIIYENYPGETPVFSGGVQLT